MARLPAGHGDDALNNSLGFADPASMFRYFSKASWSPNGINWGHFYDPKVDALLTQAQDSFDPTQQTKLLAEAHGRIVDDAPWLFVVHDLNPRALSPKVKGFDAGAELVPGFHPRHGRVTRALRPICRWLASWRGASAAHRANPVRRVGRRLRPHPHDPGQPARHPAAARGAKVRRRSPAQRIRFRPPALHPVPGMARPGVARQPRHLDVHRARGHARAAAPAPRAIPW